MRRVDYYQEIVNNLYLLNTEDLQILKRKLTPEDIKCLDGLLREAIDYGIHSVTEKKRKAPSGNPHDYMSCSIYHWPNPDTETGLPYIERDGCDNPEAIHGDKESLRTLAYITYLSGILTYVTEEEQYLSTILYYNRFWFVDPETKMNPNLRYAQCIPGVNDGEPGGIIDYAASYGYALNLLTRLYDAKLLPEEFYQEMAVWHKEFLHWLKTSAQGRTQSQRQNNQGALYDLLILNISRFLKLEDSEEDCKRLLKRIDTQIDSRGLLPLELERTKTESYTTMALKMLLESAYLLKEKGCDFSENQKLILAFRQVSPHYIQHTWDYQQIKEFDSYRGYYILYLFKRILHKDCEIQFEKKENHWGYLFIKKLYEEEGICKKQ